MKENELNAYLHLMYRAFVEIRTISVPTFNIFNPFSWNKQKKQLNRINSLANSFHNLPYDLKSENIDSFNPKEFWKIINDYEKIFSNNKCYKNVFDKVMNGEKRKILD